MGSMPQVCRLAILEADKPLPNTKAQYGTYGGVFEHLLKRGNKARGRTDYESILKVSKFDVEAYPEQYPDIDEIDAILITGSSQSSDSICLIQADLRQDTIHSLIHHGSTNW